MRVLMPCENCEETDDHECWIDGEMYGPYWEEDDGLDRPAHVPEH